MQSILRQSQPGFFKVLGGSLLAHFIVLSLGLFLFRAEPKRIFFTPVYTVNLVEPAAVKKEKKVKRAKKKRKRTHHAKKAKRTHTKKVVRKKNLKAKKTVKTRSKAKTTAKTTAKHKSAAEKKVKKKTTVKAKKTAPKTKTAAKTIKAPAVSIDKALERIKKKVEEKERLKEDALLASKIKELEEKKRAEELEARKRVQELRAKLEEERRLEEIRKRLLREAEREERKKKTYGRHIEEVPKASGAAESPASRRRPVVTADAPERISRELFELKFKEYYNQVGAKIREMWIYPGRSTGDEEVLVSVRIARDGGLLDSWIEKGSGNRLFDDSALKAVKKAAPFPPLPEAYSGDYLEIGFRFREEGA